MQLRTIDDLISDVSDKITIPDVESSRLRILDYVKYVLRRVGHELSGYPFVETMNVIDHKLQAPDYVTKIEDLSLDGSYWQGYQKPRDMVNFQPRLEIQKSPFGWTLPNFRNGCVYVRGYGMPKDKGGEAIIPDGDIYEACLNHSIGQLLLGLYQHPAYSQATFYLQTAQRHIDMAKAELNDQQTHAGERMMRQANGMTVQAWDWGNESFTNSNY